MMITLDNDLRDDHLARAWRKTELAYLLRHQDVDQMTRPLGVDMFRLTDSPTLVCR